MPSSMRMVRGITFPDSGKRCDQAHADTSYPSPSDPLRLGGALQLSGLGGALQLSDRTLDEIPLSRLTRSSLKVLQSD